MTRHDLVAKVWNYAHVLRDEGVPYGDYLEQITYLLFLKMDDERDTYVGEPSILPKGCRWADLRDLDGEALEKRYREVLERLSTSDGLIGVLFKGAQNKLTNPTRLKRVVSMINGETWIGVDIDTKGEIYEGLLERNASEVKSGAGQYFTPRPLIDAIVECVNPKIGKTVHDPASGTAGFLLSAYAHMKAQTSGDKRQLKQLREKTFSGCDIVSEVVRLAAMNLYLHGIGNGESPIHHRDALAKSDGPYDIILTNPPFGKKSSFKVIGSDGDVTTERETYERDDFKYSTSNKQLNFLQHIMTALKVGGEAAVVLPDNVLFEAGAAGEGIRTRLLKDFDFHTLLRLPTGIFYKQGVKANVLFFTKRPPSDKPQTIALWIYDLRTNMGFTLKKNRLSRDDLNDFVASYKSGKPDKRAENERFRKFDYETLIARDKTNLDIFWLKDDSLEDVDALPEPEIIAAEIVENLKEALAAFSEVEEEFEAAK
ncbi:MAG: class I SAM-dependent DNA methyltransferase [Hyphomonadaceae bacterium]